DPGHRPEGSLAEQQWATLRQVYEEQLGVMVETIDPGVDLPDMVFTANGGLVYGDRFLASRFRYPQRRPEAPRFAAWFQARGYQVFWPPEGAYFEGAGEARFCGELLLAGHGFRSSRESHKFLAQALSCSVLSLELVDPRFYHLDLALSVLDDETVVFYPGAISQESQRALREAVPRTIAIGEEEAMAFACNAVAIDGTMVMSSGASRLPHLLQEMGYRVIEVEVSEFVKAGGGVRCLTLEL
ncbi:MAG: hypothetical protein HYX89_05990, partial [Chloroflexi bacterium]|nr:hypothetical protein [Chloroflexota bacterium]